MKTNEIKKRPPVTLYALRTCTHCRQAKEFLQSHRILFRTIYLDLLLGEERSEAMRQLRSVNPAYSFPTITVGQKVIVGFKKDEIASALSISVISDPPEAVE